MEQLRENVLGLLESYLLPAISQLLQQEIDLEKAKLSAEFGRRHAELFDKARQECYEDAARIAESWQSEVAKKISAEIRKKSHSMKLRKEGEPE